MGKLTRIQREALEFLAKKRDANPTYPRGFRLRYQNSHYGASARNYLEAAGLVSIDRVTPRHFLYDITDAGRQALAAQKPARRDM